VNFLQSQISFVLALQNSPIPATLMKAATWLGSEEFFLLLIPFVYLCFDRRTGLRFGALVLCCDAFNVLLKLGFALPRPYWIDNRVVQFATDASFGLPSSHAQNAVAAWFFLARTQKKYAVIRAYFFAALIVLVISLSRVFLGVHFPLDVFAGWVFGALFLLAFWKLGPKLIAWFAARNLALQIALSVIAPIALVCAAFYLRGDINPQNMRQFEAWLEAIKAMMSRAGALCGLGIGAALAQRFARFRVDGKLGKRALCFGFAFVGILIFWRGLALIFPADGEPWAPVFRFLRYVCVACWITFGAPFLLLRLKLLESSSSRRAAEL